MTPEKLFRLILTASKPVAWSLFVVLAAVIYRIFATGVPRQDVNDVLFVGVSCLILIPVFWHFGAYRLRSGDRQG